MSRRSKSHNVAALAQSTQQRGVSHHSISRWQGGWVVWRDDGTIIQWYDTQSAAVAVLEAMDATINRPTGGDLRDA